MKIRDAGSEVLTPVVMKSYIFLNITPYSPLKVNQRYGGRSRLHFHCRVLSQARNQSETGSKQKSADDEDNKFFQNVG
jgi:hypothetical protein